MRVLPGDPLQAMVDEEGGPTSYTEEQKQLILSSLGLDRPLYEQYLSWMVDIAKGDLGFSFWRDTPIRETIQRRGPITAEIGIFAIVISWTVGLPVGIIGAIWRNSFDRLRLAVLSHVLPCRPQLLARLGVHTNHRYLLYMAPSLSRWSTCGKTRGGTSR